MFERSKPVAESRQRYKVQGRNRNCRRNQIRRLISRRHRLSRVARDGRGQTVAFEELGDLSLPHIGLSARRASTASMRAGGHFGWRGRLGRRDRGSGILSHRYSVARGTPAACAARSAFRPSAIAPRQRAIGLVAVRQPRVRDREAGAEDPRRASASRRQSCHATPGVQKASRMRKLAKTYSRRS
jgi:hypothetical protein